MTDPLTGKALVEKSYEYMVKLSKECAKALVDEFNATHRKFQQDTLTHEISSDIVSWFEKRDRNVKLISDSNVASNQQPNVAHMKFKGTTKDTEFTITGTVTTFTVPSGEGKPISFVKTLVFSVDKTNFARRKF